MSVRILRERSVLRATLLLGLSASASAQYGYGYNGNSRISDGVIAGIVIAIVVVLIILTISGVVRRHRRRGNATLPVTSNGYFPRSLGNANASPYTGRTQNAPQTTQWSSMFRPRVSTPPPPPPPYQKEALPGTHLAGSTPNDEPPPPITPPVYYAPPLGPPPAAYVRNENNQ